MSDFLDPDDLEHRLAWPPGRAIQLARQRRLPHVILPDGSIRFRWAAIERLLVEVPNELGEVAHAS